MRSKIQEVRAAITTCPYDIVVLVETWLNPTISSLEIFDASWTVFRKDRAETTSRKVNGEGVLIAVKNHLAAITVAIDDVDVEQLWVDVKTATNTIRVFAVYLPPDASSELYLTFMQTASTLLLDTASPAFVFGDTNLPRIRWVSDEFNGLVFHPLFCNIIVTNL